LLIRTAKQVGDATSPLFGQEMNGSTWALCKMNMFLHEVDAAKYPMGRHHPASAAHRRRCADEINVVVANPPFSLDNWGQDMAAEDKYGRFNAASPEKQGRLGLHLPHAGQRLEGTGRVGVVVPHGVLFRGGQEARSANRSSKRICYRQWSACRPTSSMAPGSRPPC
jgi:type I restriction enzyme M protein